VPKYIVKRYWELCDEVGVDADSVNEAIKKAQAQPLDITAGEYVPDSINSDPDVDVQVSKNGGTHG